MKERRPSVLHLESVGVGKEAVMGNALDHPGESQ
jgi:hypothetical protein